MGSEMSFSPLWDKEWQWFCGTGLRMLMRMCFEWGFFYRLRCLQPTGCLFSIQDFACPLFYLLRAQQLCPGAHRWGIWIAPGVSNLVSGGQNYPHERQGHLPLHLQFHSAAYVGSYLLIFSLKPFHLLCSSFYLPTSSGGNGVNLQIPVSGSATVGFHG